MKPMGFAPMPPKKGSFKRLMAFVFKAYGVRLIVAGIFIVLSSLAAIVVNVYTQQLIDDCIVPGLESGLASVMKPLIRVTVSMALVFFIGLLCSFIYPRIMAVVTQGSLQKLRDAMFNHMQGLPIRYFDTHPRGEVMSTYTNDTDATRQLIGQCLPTTLQSVLSVVITFFTMLSYSLWLTLAVFVIMGVMLYVTKHIASVSSRYMIAQQRSLASTEGYIEEMIQGQKVVKVFCHEAACEKDFDALNEQLYRDSETANRSGNVLMPILGNIGNLMYVIVAILGGLMLYLNVGNLSLSGFGTVTIGVIVSFLGMSRQLAQTVGQISMQLPQITMGLAGASRIFELLDEQPETDGGTVTLEKVESGTWAWKIPGEEDTALAGEIRMEHVDFAYKPEKTVLHDISLTAQPGQKIALVGATGAGKTTITNLLNRFYDIRDGAIYYDGIELRKICKPDLRRSLGIVLQDVNLFTGSVMDNIRYGRLDATDEECIAAAKLANADDFITRLPEGYDTQLTGNGANLSQGQRQLLSIARAAVADPPVMILDEATSSIDTRTEALVQAGMDNLMTGRTVFVIAHRLSTVRNADVILVLDHGNIIERGNHEELLAQKGNYYQLYTGAFELE